MSIGGTAKSRSVGCHTSYYSFGTQQPKYNHFIRRRGICFPPLIFQLQVHGAPVPTDNLVVSCHPDLKGVRAFRLDSNYCLQLFAGWINWSYQSLLKPEQQLLSKGGGGGCQDRQREGQQERENLYSSVMIMVVLKKLNTTSFH